MTPIEGLLGALEAADEAITDAINDYVPCRCRNIVPGDPASHGECSTRELLAANIKVRAVLGAAPIAPAPTPACEVCNDQGRGFDVKRQQTIDCPACAGRTPREGETP